MAPKVSVIVPVYNVAEYLGQCLDTILLQTLQDIEVICVDDGSTDDSLNILNMYAMFDERLKVIHQENAGLGPARNRGMKEATGEFIIFLDSDDFFHPEMLEKMVTKAEEDGSDMVICGYSSFDSITERDYNEQKIDIKYLIDSPIVPQNYWSDLFNICSAVVWTKLIKFDLIKKYNLKFFDDKYAEDLPFSYIAMALSQKISLLEDCFVHYRQKRKGQLTDNRHKRHGANVVIPLTELYDNLKRFNIEKVFLEAYISRFYKTLAWELQGRTPEEQREFLNQFIKKLSPEIAKMIFGYGNKENKISIVIAVHNAAPFLQECLESCLNQTLKEIEIICVDDGSTDNSLDILNAYAKRDDRVKVLVQENQRQSIARYNAMKIATGEYVWYVDADDYLDLDSCECLYLYAKIYDLDMLSFACIDFKNDTKFEYEEPYHTLKWLPEKYLPVFTWKHVCSFATKLAVTAPLTIYRHQYLLDQDITWINRKVAYEDTPFFTEAMLKNARMGACPEKFYHKRVHGDATTQNMDKNFSDYCWIVDYTFELIQKILHNTAVLHLFADGYLTKVYLNYQRLLPEIQKKMAYSFFKLYFRAVKRYHVVLSDSMKKLCSDYWKKKSLKKWIEFGYYSLLAKWAFYGYSIRPFNVTFKTNFMLSIFGFPVCQILTDESNGCSLDRKIVFLKILNFKMRHMRIISTAVLKVCFRCKKTTNKFPVDLVYLWCDGADPKFQEQKNYWLTQEGKELDQQATAPGRFLQVDELKYSLRSVAKYIPWIHHIFIVTAGQVPTWLNLNHPKITIVDHTEIISKKYLPTFNSSAIETALYKIPNLSEHFLYANDDTFIGSPLGKDYFFDNGKPIIRLREVFLDPYNQYYTRLLNMIFLVERDFGKIPFFSGKNIEPHHNIDAYLKSDYQACAEHFKKEYEDTLTHRFRKGNSVQRFIVAIWSFVHHHAQLKKLPDCWNKPKTPQMIDSYVISNHMPETFENFSLYNPSLFCVNSSEHTTSKDLERTKEFLEKLFPDKSEFEK